MSFVFLMKNATNLEMCTHYNRELYSSFCSKRSNIDMNYVINWSGIVVWSVENTKKC